MKILLGLVAIAAMGFVGLVVIGANMDHRIPDAQRAVQALLKDPDSAKFSNVRVKEGSAFVCGLVNARNGFGGFAGAKPFAYDSDTQLAAVFSGPRDAFVWSSLAKGCFPDMQIPKNAMEAESLEATGFWLR